MPNIQPSKSEQYPRLLDSSPHGNLSLPQPVSSIAPNAAKDKIAKEIKVNYFFRQRSLTLTSQIHISLFLIFRIYNFCLL